MQADELKELLSPVIADMGFELVGVEKSDRGRHAFIRLYVDKPGGINIDELASVSRQSRDVMRVAGVDVEATTLEVSSPGVKAKSREGS